ncbi:MAG: serine protease [Halobacteriota archaeon]
MALLPVALDSVVAIGYVEQNGTMWGATGFLVGRPVIKDGCEIGRHVFLVTNKHVLEGENSVVLRFNPERGKETKDYRVPLIDDERETPQRWVSHPHDDLDIAVIGLHGAKLKEDGQQILSFDVETLMTIDQMRDANVSEGDPVYVLGYPMGLIDRMWRYPIARSGSVARIQDALERPTSSFLLDTFVFPGNSGSPVILSRPQYGASTDRTQPIDFPCVIGIVSAYLPYEDIVVSLQTKEQRIKFVENSGLASALPSDYILETIEVAVKNAGEGPDPTSLYLW